MLDGSLIFYHYLSNYWIFCKDIYTTTQLFYTTTTLNITTTLSLFNKNAALEILFIQSPVNVIFMIEEMGSCMAGT